MHNVKTLNGAQISTAANDVLNTMPKMRDLICIVFPKIRAKWKFVAYLMNYTTYDVNAFENDSQNLEESCLNLFTDWLTTDKGIKPKTWHMLIKEIKKVNGLQYAAEDITKEVKELYE